MSLIFNIISLVIILLLNLKILIQFKYNFSIFNLTIFVLLFLITNFFFNYSFMIIITKLINYYDIFFLIKLKNYISTRIIYNIGLINFFFKLFVLFLLLRILIIKHLDNKLIVTLYIIFFLFKIIYFLIDLKITMIQVLSKISFKKLKLTSQGLLKIEKYKLYLITGVSELNFVDSIGEYNSDEFIQMIVTDFCQNISFQK